MSRNVDTNVVEMRFDNQEFERGVQTSLRSIDNLKQGLKFDGATQGLADVSRAAGRVDFTGLGSGIDAVSLKFNALYTMADQVFRNITNSAWNAGKNIAKQFTIEPITAGFSEYETQIGAIQTILANTESKGTTLQDVNRALDQLNAYADKTIYNFTEMTRNIGTFTAAGTDLDTSVTAIQGIANLAAVSGSTSQQASTAMYQLSQAMASGTVKLMDWNSVVNAGMGGQVFQDALKETARVHGIAVDEMIEENGSFRESLKEGWITTEILTETLSHFTMATDEMTEAEKKKNREMLKSQGYTDEQIDNIFKLGQTATDAATKVKTFSQLQDTLKEAAQSGWTQTWETIIGDFEESKELWTTVSDTVGGFINKMSESRNKLLGGALDTNWEQLVGKINEAGVETEEFEKMVRNVAKVNGVDVDAMIEKYGSLRNAFREGAIDSKILKQALGQLVDQETLVALLSDGVDDLINNITALGGREILIEALKDVFNGLLTVVKPIKDAFTEIFPPATSEQLFSLIEKFKEFTAKLKLSDAGADKLKRTFKGLFAVVQIVWRIFVAVGKALSPVLDIFDAIISLVFDITAGLGDMIVGFNDATKKMDTFGAIADWIRGGLEKVRDVVVKFTTGIANAFNGISDAGAKGVGSFVDRIGKRLSPLEGIVNFFKSMISSIVDKCKEFAPAFQTIGNEISRLFKSMWERLIKSFETGDFSWFVDIVNGGVGIGIGVAIKNFIGGITDAVTGEGSVLVALREILDGVKDCFKAWQDQIKANTLMTIAKAVAILAAALIILSLVDSNKLLTAMAGISFMFLELFAAMKVMESVSLDKEGRKSFSQISTAMIGLSVAVLILASATAKLAKLDWNGVAKGLVGVGVLLAEMLAFLKFADLGQIGFKKATGILVLAVAISVMASAVQKLGAMDLKGAIQGVVALGFILAGIAGFLKLTGGPSSIAASAIGLVVLGGALLVFAKAIEALGSMSTETLGIGLLAMAGALTVISAALNLMPKSTALIGAGLLIVSVALLAISGVMSIMGGLSWEAIAKGLVAIGGSLAIIAGSMLLMQNALPGAAALLIVAAALAAITPVLMALGSLSWGELGMSLLTLAGTFVILGGAAYVLSPLIPALLGLSVAMSLFGVAALAVGAGIALFATGLATLGGSAVVVAEAIRLIVMRIASLIPYIIEQIGVGLVALFGVIANAGSAICAMITTILQAIIEALQTVLPQFMELVGTALSALLDLLITYTPKVIEWLGVLLDGLINLLVEYTPRLLEYGIDTGLQLILGLLKGIRDNISDVVDISLEIIAEFIRGIGIGLPKIINASVELVINFINGMANGIRENTPKMIAAVDNLMDAVMDAIKQWFSAAKGKGTELLTNVKEGITSKFTDLKNAGRDAIQGFINGIKEKVTGAWEAAKEVGASALNGIKSFLGIKSPSREMAAVGRYSDEGLIMGLKAYTGRVATAAKNVGNTALDSIRGAIAGMSDIVSSDIDSEPTIRPVLDLSGVRSGANAISGMLSDKTLSVNTRSANATAAAMFGVQNGGNRDVVSAINKLNKKLDGVRGNTYSINGLSYSDGDVASAFETIVRAARVEGRA